MRDRSSRGASFSVDVVLVTATGNELAVLLARNANERERWSLPWRPQQTGETFELSATRASQEALGESASWMEQIGAFGDGKRHPSDAEVSIAYLGLVPHETASPRAGFTWFHVADLPPISPRKRAMVEVAITKISTGVTWWWTRTTKTLRAASIKPPSLSVCSRRRLRSAICNRCMSCC